MRESETGRERGRGRERQRGRVGGWDRERDMQIVEDRGIMADKK